MLWKRVPPGITGKGTAWPLRNFFDLCKDNTPSDLVFFLSRSGFSCPVIDFFVP